MSWVHRCMIVPAEHAPIARNLCAGLAPGGGDGMFLTELSASGATPATHYVSTGMIEAPFADLLIPAAAGPVHQLAVDAGMAVTLAEIESLLYAADISAEAPHDAFARLGLALIAGEM